MHPTAERIAYALRDLCPGLSPEGAAAALGIELRPGLGVRYRYVAAPSPAIEYDALATPAEQQRMVHRGVVLHMLGRLGPLTSRAPSVITIADQVWSACALTAAQRGA